MTTRSLAQPAHRPNHDSREARALDLYRTRGHQIIRVVDDLYLVPSSDGSTWYEVLYGGDEERCSCPDHRYRGVTCIHLYAVGISHAKRRGESRPCACINGVVYIGHLVDGAEVIEPVPCRRCSR